MSAPPSSPSSIDGALTRTPQIATPGPFSSDQLAYLKTKLSSFNEYRAELTAKGTGQRGLKGVKGKQKDWVQANVYHEYIKKFNITSINKHLLLEVRRADCGIA